MRQREVAFFAATVVCLMCRLCDVIVKRRVAVKRVESEVFMLVLHNIVKDYVMNENTVHVLKGVDVCFRKWSLSRCSVLRVAAKQRFSTS